MTDASVAPASGATVPSAPRSLARALVTIGRVARVLMFAAPLLDVLHRAILLSPAFPYLLRQFSSPSRLLTLILLPVGVTLQVAPLYSITMGTIMGALSHYVFFGAIWFFATFTRRALIQATGDIGTPRPRISEG